jgi:hypothetical protein
MQNASITDPVVEHRPSGGHDGRPCRVVHMYKDECRVSGESDTWFVEAPYFYDGAWAVWAVWAGANTREDALVLAGEYFRDSRDRQMRYGPLK